MDVTTLGVHLDIIHENLRRQYLSCETFSTGSMFPANFQSNVKDGILIYIGSNNVTQLHPLHFIPIQNPKEVTKRSRKLMIGPDKENEDSDFNLIIFMVIWKMVVWMNALALEKTLPFAQHVIDAFNNCYRTRCTES